MEQETGVRHTPMDTVHIDGCRGRGFNFQPQSRRLVLVELQHEIGRESVEIAANRAIQGFCLCSI